MILAERFSFFVRKFLFILFFSYSLCSLAQDQSYDDSLPDHIVGDIGLATYTSNLHLGTYGTQTFIAPYAFADYKRAFVRIDMFGIKTAKIGYGYLEFTGKAIFDNYVVKSPYTTNTIVRRYPIPIGIGTFQETPVGAFLINAYHDFSQSKGALYEFSYFGKIETIKKVIIYPQFGIEKQSSQYSNYYYGLTNQQANSIGYQSYTAPATNNLMAGFLLEIPVIDSWYINIYGKRKWMGSGISNSPVMNRSFQDNLFMALAYRFE